MRTSSPTRSSYVLAVAVALVGTVIGVTGQASAQRAPEPRAVAAAGATLPFSSTEAESASTTGQKIGPDYTQGALASEASGRQAVRLSSGQSVEFTLDRAANAVNVAYNVPDGQSGSLAVYVNGTELDASLAVTSKYSYVDTPWIAGAKTHHLFDNARLLLGRDLAAGDKVKLEAASTEVTVDVADFEQVDEPATAPSGAVSVVDKGADATGQQDSTQVSATRSPRPGQAAARCGSRRATSSWTPS